MRLFWRLVYVWNTGLFHLHPYFVSVMIRGENRARRLGNPMSHITAKEAGERREPGIPTKQPNIPDDLPGRLAFEKENEIADGIYQKLQIDFAYHSNRIEGSRLSLEQTRYIFVNHTIRSQDGPVNVDDILETVNHFRCVDMMIDRAKQPLTEEMIRQLHRILKRGTTDSRRSWFAVGEYKKFPNEVGGMETTPPKDVPREMRKLLSDYEKLETVSFDDLLEFHRRFETIHPFQDGNGRVGRLILFKECLRNGIVPFIIEDDIKMYYYRGLRQWKTEKGYLRDTCLTSQDRFKGYLDYFGAEY